MIRVISIILLWVLFGLLSYAYYLCIINVFEKFFKEKNLYKKLNNINIILFICGGGLAYLCLFIFSLITIFINIGRKK